MGRPLLSLEQLLTEDLETICTDLASELGEMAGGRLLVTGGGGFLGYYLVQSALHWNRTRKRRGADRPDGLRQLHARRAGSGSSSCAGSPDLQLVRQDMIQPLPADIGHFDYIVHAAGIASPIYYRAQPLKCIDANINGLRNLLDYSVAEREAGRPVRGLPVLLVERDLRRPGARRDPDARDLSRQRVLHRPARLLRRVQALRRDAVRASFAQPARRAGEDGAAVQQLRPGPEDHRRPRDAGFCARRVRRPRHRHALRRQPTRTFCYATDAITGYYKVLVQGPTGEPTTSASTDRRSRWRSWRTSCVDDGGRPVRLPGPGRARQERRRRTTSSTTRTAAARSSTRRAANSATTRGCWSRRASTARWSGTTTTVRRRRPDAHLNHRNGLCRARVGRLPGRASATTSSAWTSTRPRSTRSTRVGAPIHEAGLPELLQRVVGRRRCGPRPTSQGPCSPSDVTFIAVGTPAARRQDRPAVRRARGRADRRGAAGQAGLSHGRRQEHGGAGHHRRCRCARRSKRARAWSRVVISASA